MSHIFRTALQVWAKINRKMAVLPTSPLLELCYV